MEVDVLDPFSVATCSPDSQAGVRLGPPEGLSHVHHISCFTHPTAHIMDQAASCKARELRINPQSLFKTKTHLKFETLGGTGQSCVYTSSNYSFNKPLKVIIQ